MSSFNGYDNIIKLIDYEKDFLTPIANSHNNNDYSDRRILYCQVLENSSIDELKDYANGTSSKYLQNKWLLLLSDIRCKKLRFFMA